MEFARDALGFTAVPGTDYATMKWVEIHPELPLYEILLGYIASHPKENHSNDQGYRVTLLPAAKKEPDNYTNDILTGRVKVKIGLGRFTFKGLNGETFYAEHKTVGEPVGLNYSVEVYTRLKVYTSGPLQELGRFMSDLLDLSEKTDEGKFICMTWNVCREYWHQNAHVTARPMSSVVLPQATKDRLVKDIERFLLPQTTTFYLRNGIPYRRSYLFHGIPGTGKTSLVQALAGHFKRSVCFLQPTHPKMTDDSLREAIARLPEDAIVVFEDIDSLFAKNRSNKVSQSCLTFSGLLNALDGIGDPSGQICIMTTNLREELDHALIRNGRVDMHVEFTYAVPEQMELMWRNFYPNKEDAALAETFASRVTETLDSSGLHVTTSGLQHFFVTNMDSTAEQALDDVQSIVEEIKRNSSQGMLQDATTATTASNSTNKPTNKKKKNKKAGVKLSTAVTATATDVGGEVEAKEDAQDAAFVTAVDANRAATNKAAATPTAAADVVVSDDGDVAEQSQD